MKNVKKTEDLSCDQLRWCTIITRIIGERVENLFVHTARKALEAAQES